MGALLKTALRRGLAWLTGKFIGEVFVSAVATVLLTAVFSGSTFRAETVPAAVPALPVIAAMTAPETPTTFKVSLDNPAFAMAPDSFTFDVPSPPAHRPATGVKTAAPAHAVPVPKPRPAAEPAAAQPAAAPQPASAPAAVQDVAAAEAPAVPPPQRSFTVFGIGAGDLVPSPKRILGRVTSVGHSIADLADWL